MFKRILITLVSTIFILGISKMSFAMMCGSHSQHQQTAQAESKEHEHTEHQAVTETASKEAVNVGNKICPVSGEKIDEKTKATYEYGGKIYNFCCAMCIDEFKKDPQKYIKKVEEELRVASKAKENQRKMLMNREPESSGDEDVHRGHHH